MLSESARATSAAEARFRINDANSKLIVTADEGLRAGLVECPALPHAATIEILELLDETRRQIGVSYPGDDEYLGG